jgi:hypothetical protein
MVKRGIVAAAVVGLAAAAAVIARKLLAGYVALTTLLASARERFREDRGLQTIEMLILIIVVVILALALFLLLKWVFGRGAAVVETAVNSLTFS